MTWSGDEAKAAGRCGCVAAARARGRRDASRPSRRRIGTSHRRPARPGHRAPAGRLDGAVGRGACSEQRAVLAVDLPSGLDADTGHPAPRCGATHTLSLLTLEARLVHRRRARCLPARSGSTTWASRRRRDRPPPGCPAPPAQPPRLHAIAQGQLRRRRGHRRRAGHGRRRSAGRVGRAACGRRPRVRRPARQRSRRRVDAAQPDLMLRRLGFAGPGGDGGRLRLRRRRCGARGAAQGAVDRAGAGARCRRAERASPPIRNCRSLLQARSRRGRATVLTPHPLEAARLLGCDRGGGAGRPAGCRRELAQRFGCVVVLKGSGSVDRRAGRARLLINPTGNARLATAGTGDVLAGMIARRGWRPERPRSRPRPARPTRMDWRRTMAGPAPTASALRRPSAARRASHDATGALECGSSAALTLRAQPRPTKGILVAITVWNSTLASSGRLAM